MDQNFWSGFEKEALMAGVGQSASRMFTAGQKMLAQDGKKLWNSMQTIPKPMPLPAAGTKLKNAKPGTLLQGNPGSLLKHKNTKYVNTLRPGQTGFHGGKLDPLQRGAKVLNHQDPTAYASIKATPKRTKFLATTALAGGAYLTGRMHGGQAQQQPQPGYQGY